MNDAQLRGMQSYYEIMAAPTIDDLEPSTTPQDFSISRPIRRPAPTGTTTRRRQLIASQRTTPALSAKALCRAMLVCMCPMLELKERTGIPLTRIRIARRDGIEIPAVARDWLQAICRRDPGEEQWAGFYEEFALGLGSGGR